MDVFFFFYLFMFFADDVQRFFYIHFREHAMVFYQSLAVTTNIFSQ